MAEGRKRDRAGPIHAHVGLAYRYSGWSRHLATVSERNVHALQDRERSWRGISFGRFRIAPWLRAAGSGDLMCQYRCLADARSSHWETPATTSRSYPRPSTRRRNGRQPWKRWSWSPTWAARGCSCGSAWCERCTIASQPRRSRRPASARRHTASSDQRAGAKVAGVSCSRAAPSIFPNLAGTPGHGPRYRTGFALGRRSHAHEPHVAQFRRPDCCPRNCERLHSMGHYHHNRPISPISIT